MLNRRVWHNLDGETEMASFTPLLPLVLNGLGAGQPLLDVDTHQGPDEGLGLVTDVVPVRRVKLKFA